jgi:hypothetical protein
VLPRPRTQAIGARRGRSLSCLQNQFFPAAIAPLVGQPSTLIRQYRLAPVKRRTTIKWSSGKPGSWRIALCIHWRGPILPGPHHILFRKSS